VFALGNGESGAFVEAGRVEEVMTTKSHREAFGGGGLVYAVERSW
jgi:hypothetical protein